MTTNLDARALNSLNTNTDPSQHNAEFDGLKDSIDGLQK